LIADTHEKIKQELP